MSKNSSSKSSPIESEITLPFSAGKVLAIAPALIVLLVMCGIYFSGVVQLMLGLRAMDEDGQENKAVEYFNWALSINPNLALAYAQRGIALMEIEHKKGAKADYKAARRDLDQAVKLDPKNSNYYESRLKIDHFAQNYRAEIAGYDHLFELKEYMRESLTNERAALYYIVGDFKNERTDRESIVKSESETLDGYAHSIAKPGKFALYDELALEPRAEQYRFLGEIEKATRDYEVCVKNDPKAEDLWHLAYLYENSGRSPQALKIYTKLIELSDQHESGSDAALADAVLANADTARSKRANLYLKFGENEKALADADEMLTTDESSEKRLFRAKVLDAMGRKSEATAERNLADSKLTTDLNGLPKDADKETRSEALVARADFYAAEKQWKNALTYYSAALVIDPSSTNQLECAKLYTKLGDYDNAIAFFSKAITPASSDDEVEEAYNGLAKVHLLQKKPLLAVEDCTKAITLDESDRDGESSYLRGKAYRMLGKNELAKIDENESIGLEFSPPPDDV